MRRRTRVGRGVVARSVTLLRLGRVTRGGVSGLCVCVATLKGKEWEWGSVDVLGVFYVCNWPGVCGATL